VKGSMRRDVTLSRLGLAMRAGKVISGEDAVVGAVRSGKARLVIVSEDISENTYKKIREKCAFYGVQLLQGYSRWELGHSIGKPERVAVAVTDDNFANLIRKGFAEIGGGGTD